MRKSAFKNHVAYVVAMTLLKLQKENTSIIPMQVDLHLWQSIRSPYETLFMAGMKLKKHEFIAVMKELDMLEAPTDVHAFYNDLKKVGRALPDTIHPIMDEYMEITDYFEAVEKLDGVYPRI